MQRPLIYKQLYLETPNESRPQNGKRDYKELFLTLDKVSLKALTLKGSCIFICGDTRTGKSTLHNCLVNPKVLVGKEEGLNNYYVLRDSNNPEVAMIGNSLTSVTIIPNVSFLNDQTAVIDLAGMGERRDGVEVIKVNYINANFFAAAKKAKFIVVFTQGALKDIDNGGFKDTLHNFLSFFNAQHFSSVQEKKQLFSSIAFCFTSVDFRRKKYETVKQKYLSELSVMIEKLEKWYQAKPSQMPSFPLAKELVQTIVSQKRIQLFQLAIEGQSPVYNNFIQSFDKNNWKYLNIREKIDKIKYHYDKQYQALDQPQRKRVDDAIEWRFSFNLKMRGHIGQMLEKLINNFGQKTINIDEKLKNFHDILKDLPIYDHLVQQSEVSQVCTIDQRLLCFQKLDQAAKKVQDLDTWQQTNKLSPLSEYFTRHLARMFEEQIILIKRLFSYSLDALKMLKRLQTNVNKMLAQAAIFARLSKNYESRFKRKFADQIIFGNQISSIQQVKKKFIDFFQNDRLQIQDYKADDVKRIIKVLGELKGEFKKINPIIFYKISFNLKHMLASIYRKDKMIPQFVEQSYSAIIEGVKQHICLALVPLSSYESDLQQLVGRQRNILRQTEQVFNAEKNRNRNRINGSIQLKLAFESLVSSKDRDEFKSIVKSIFMILADFMRAQFKNINLTKEQMLPAITVSSNANNEAEIHMILSQYYTAMKSQINEEKIRIETPSSYSFVNQAQQYDKIKQKIKDKKIIFVLGESLGGKSTFIQIFKRQKMSFNKYGRFDLEKQCKLNKINHTNIPSQYPSITSLDQNEVFLEIPFFHDLQPQEKYIKMSIFVDMMKSIRKFRIVWVVKEATFKGKLFENSISQVIKLLMDKKLKQPKESVIILAINHLIHDQTVIRNTLESHIQSLTPVDKKVAKYLTCIKNKNQIICVGMNKYEQIATDFQTLILEGPQFDSSNLTITYGQLCTKFIPDKQLLNSHILGKITLVRNALNILKGIASDSLCEFFEGTKLSEKNWFYNDITRCLEDPIVKGYEVDLSNLAKYETTVGLIDNRPFIYHKVIQLRKAAQVLDTEYDFNVAYQRYGNYMEHFFNNMFYLCCINKDQYLKFMKFRIILAMVLKELEYYSLIFKEGKLQDYRFEQIDGWLRFRDIQDSMTNFTDMKVQELITRLMLQAARWKDNELRSYIELLGFFIKSKTAITPVRIAAMIELLVFTLRLKASKNLIMSWDKDLSEKRLIEWIFNYPFIQKNSSKNLLAFGKFQQLATETTLNELTGLKMKLIA